MWLAALVGCGFEVFTFTLSDVSESTISGESAADGEVLSLDDLVDIEKIGREKLEEAGVEEGDLSQLRILGLHVELIDPPEANLDFIRSVEVWLSADGLDDVLIASEEEIPLGVSELSIEVADVDIAPYIFAEGLSASAFASGQPPAEDLTVQTTVEVEVGVTARGAWSQLTGR